MQSHLGVLELLPKYFQGMYAGDTDMLRSIFHPDAVLFSVVEGRPGHRTLHAWLEGVASRKSPKASGETMASEVLSVSVIGDIAFATVRCPMLGFNYHDVLTFNRIDDRWKIVTKTFTHIAPPSA